MKKVLLFSLILIAGKSFAQQQLNPLWGIGDTIVDVLKDSGGVDNLYHTVDTSDGTRYYFKSNDLRHDRAFLLQIGNKNNFKEINFFNNGIGTKLKLDSNGNVLSISNSFYGEPFYYSLVLDSLGRIAETTEINLNLSLKEIEDTEIKTMVFDYKRDLIMSKEMDMLFGEKNDYDPFVIELETIISYLHLKNGVKYYYKNGEISRIEVYKDGYCVKVKNID